ncbi:MULTISPECIES: hypothetical protein [unclassified Microcoleus]|uniref:hypothetical protein n=1 Tax=unclassified Microcoleus TaxID=2642155 RepID=UPI002FD17B87
MSEDTLNRDDFSTVRLSELGVISIPVAAVMIVDPSTSLRATLLTVDGRVEKLNG